MTSPAANGAPNQGRARAIADSLSSREWDQLTDVVLRRIEGRVADELARRGRRATPRVW